MNILNKKDEIIIFSHHASLSLEKLYPFLNEVKKPFVIVSAMEDYSFPDEINSKIYNTVYTNPYFVHWFSINKTIPNDEKTTSIPYGLDYHTLTRRNYFGEEMQDFETQNTKLQNIVDSQVHFSKRIHKIYANFHLHITDTRNGGWRSKLKDIIPSNIIYFEAGDLPRTSSWKKTSEYSFVVSPPGNGHDCIRTFEALCLGCIVIMKKSFLDIIYEDLPILLVDEYTDINEELLERTIEEFSEKQFNYSKLYMDYWVKLVHSKFS
jgi:hypothetical protein